MFFAHLINLHTRDKNNLADDRSRLYEMNDEHSIVIRALPDEACLVDQEDTR